MTLMNILKSISKWTLPVGVYDLARTYYYPALPYYFFNKNRLFNRNKHFRNLHKGMQCFILCNGPSVNKQNLLPLQNEIVFSVSSGYHHKDYHIIRPKYHCVPQITYGLMTEDDAVRWFQEMDKKLCDAELFFNYSEEAIVKKHKLFQTRKVHYVCLSRKFSPDETDIIDISGIMPGVQSVPIMCLMIAMYMGFNKIYLLGTEHDSFITGKYDYFYAPTVLKGKDIAVDSNGVVINPLYEEFQSLVNLWKQYRILKNIARSNHVSIINATAGGALDEFERADLNDILSGNV
jgi:hypothetical protein